MDVLGGDGSRGQIGVDEVATLVEAAPELVASLRSDLTVVYLNQAAEDLLGHPRREVLGRSVADYVHPDDLERALVAVVGWQNWGSPAGATSFRLRHADGSWHEFDIVAKAMQHGDVEHLVVYARPADYQHAIEAVLGRLLAGAPLAECLAPVLDVISWAVNDASVAISWYEPEVGHRFVSTGVPGPLVGADDDAGTPWARARTAGAQVFETDHGAFDAARRALIADHARGSVWIVPVTDPGSPVPTLITVWGGADGRPPTGHTYGMQITRLYVELILGWNHQLRALRDAANRDALTGLANRRSFFEALEKVRSGGAVLYCDLDDFKPVNDRLGHSAGDEVLRIVATRLQACVREDDLVARTGGDEFVVLARGATPAQAADLAARLGALADEPVVLASGETVRVGLSVGWSCDVAHITEETLVAADRDLLTAKWRRRPLPAAEAMPPS